MICNLGVREFMNCKCGNKRNNLEKKLERAGEERGEHRGIVTLLVEHLPEGLVTGLEGMVSFHPMTFCAVCYRSADIGHLVSHAKNRVRHIRKVNLHAAHITIDGVRKRVKLCSRCKRDSRQIEKARIEKKTGKPTLEKSSKKKAGK